MKLLISMATVISLCVSPVSVVNAKLSAPVMALAKQCAPDIHPLTMGYIVGHESGNSNFAIGVNLEKGQTKPPFEPPKNQQEAVALVSWLTTHGYNFDVGLGQINSKNFPMLNVTASQLFDGCTNLRAAQKVLKTCYAKAVSQYPAGQIALRHALSCYNTGSLTAGISNGYVALVAAQVPQPTPTVPAFKPDGITDSDADVNDISSGSEPAGVSAESKEGSQVGDSDAFSNTSADAFDKANAGAFSEKRASPGA